jgi:hypothetical protein
MSRRAMARQYSLNARVAAQESEDDTRHSRRNSDLSAISMLFVWPSISPQPKTDGIARCAAHYLGYPGFVTYKQYAAARKLFEHAYSTDKIG